MKQKVAVSLEKVDENNTEPCCFCSSPEHEALIQERGIITADYRMENTYGVTMGYTCDICAEIISE